MSNALRDSIHQMATEFASAVLRAIRGASLDDILSETSHGPVSGRRGPGRPPRNVGDDSAGASSGHEAARRVGRKGRLGRRTTNDIAAVVERIVKLLEAHPEGLRAEELRRSLDLEAKELPRPISDALAAYKISKQGEKRATTYFAGGGRARSAAGKAGRANKATKGNRAAGAKQGGKRRAAGSPKVESSAGSGES
jgi:hypothetical protein